MPINTRERLAHLKAVSRRRKRESPLRIQPVISCHSSAYQLQGRGDLWHQHPRAGHLLKRCVFLPISCLVSVQLTSSLCLRHSLTAPQAQHALGGNLERIKRVVRLGGFVNVTAGYTAIAPVMNGCSDFIVRHAPHTPPLVSHTCTQVKVLGEKGRHARAAVGTPNMNRFLCLR